MTNPAGGHYQACGPTQRHCWHATHRLAPWDSSLRWSALTQTASVPRIDTHSTPTGAEDGQFVASTRPSCSCEWGGGLSESLGTGKNLASAGTMREHRPLAGRHTCSSPTISNQGGESTIRSAPSPRHALTCRTNPCTAPSCTPRRRGSALLQTASGPISCSMTVMGRPDWRTWRPAATLGDNPREIDVTLHIE